MMALLQLNQKSKTTNLGFIKIINMIENRGHAECIAYGINYINKMKTLIIYY